MVDEGPLLNAIAQKLDTLIAISKLANRDKINAYVNQIRDDSVSAKILELSTEAISYGSLIKAVTGTTNSAEITVKRRIADLRELGALAVTRQGRDAFYQNTGLLG